MPHEIDLCVAMQGPNVDLLSCIFLKSLLRTVELDGPVQKVTLYVVNNGIPDDHVPGIENILNKAGVRWQMHDSRGKFTLTTAWNNVDVTHHAGANTAAVCEWMLENCGTAEWCLISHFDILWQTDLLKNMAQRITPQHGMFGKHDPMMLVRRAAYRQIRVPLRNVADYYAVPYGNRYRIFHGSDRRRILREDSIYVGGFDVAELFEVMLPAYGWVHEALEEEFPAGVYHFRSGSGYHGDTVNRDIRQRAHDMVRNEGFG